MIHLTCLVNIWDSVTDLLQDLVDRVLDLAIRQPILEVSNVADENMDSFSECVCDFAVLVRCFFFRAFVVYVYFFKLTCFVHYFHFGRIVYYTITSFHCV